MALFLRHGGLMVNYNFDKTLIPGLKAKYL